MGHTERVSLRRLYPRRIDIPLQLSLCLVLLAVGLVTPVLTVRKLLVQDTFSILTGIQALWFEGDRAIACLIFVFSVVFPILKISAMGLIWFIPSASSTRRWVLDGLETLGRWSMLDVFVVAVTIVAIKLGIFVNARPRAGLACFGGAVVLSMALSLQMNTLARRAEANGQS